MSDTLLAFFIFNWQDSFNSTLDFLNKQSGILTLISILAAIGVFFFQQHSEKDKFNQRIVNACKALLTDLKHLEQTYASGKLIKTSAPERGIDYSNTSIGTEYYDSVVNSGLITYFNEKTQVELSDFFYNILLFNEWIKEFNHFGFYSPLDQSARNNIMNKMAQKLTNHENEIKAKLPVVKHLLDDEINKYNGII